jgi:hypothetical protein
MFCIGVKKDNYVPLKRGIQCSHQVKNNILEFLYHADWIFHLVSQLFGISSILHIFNQVNSNVQVLNTDSEMMEKQKVEQNNNYHQ